jgi:hypothetical protein
MKANELRIGNLLRDKVTKTELKVIELTEVNIITYVIDRSKFPLQDGWGIEPIPLTEEWLLKFGFEKLSNGWLRLHICNDWSYLYWDRLAGLELSVNKQGIHFSHIKHVHQLQNLYFALTGEELIYESND